MGILMGFMGMGFLVRVRLLERMNILMVFKEMGIVLKVRRYSENENCNELRKLGFF
jgi:hypothetical protein